MSSCASDSPAGRDDLMNARRVAVAGLAMVLSLGVASCAKPSARQAEVVPPPPAQSSPAVPSPAPSETSAPSTSVDIPAELMEAAPPADTALGEASTSNDQADTPSKQVAKPKSSSTSGAGSGSLKSTGSNTPSAEKSVPRCSNYEQGADLHNCKLTGANWKGLNLLGANITRANLSSAKLSAVTLRQAQGPGSSFFRASLNASDFRDFRGPMADFRSTRAIASDFTRAVLPKSDWSKAKLTAIDFSQADLRGARFVQTDLSESDLKTADLTGVDASYANLDHAQINVELANRMKLTGVDLGSVYCFRYAELAGELMEASVDCEFVVDPRSRRIDTRRLSK